MEHKKIVLKTKRKPTPEQIKMLHDAAELPLVYDEDIPPQNAEQLSEFDPEMIKKAL